ncbi:Protein CBG00208 [Caenorhabditis briggsae]|uniref:Serpentine receptor class gamma n=2 Tax=Caenorhabditis briggsae TaxID=6238 RepID=A0AAE9FHE5_CAEBR|nr:Protein CBG00208 [Caenorhabditis briggsae]ULT83636.1 hypothetical protein L3Y34_012699 [Caenorhabditis briggsae]UMM42898.1 hypothetical protein L5515_018555 [Caenorhabditis briggsae]CAP21676.2 Protein CBG00208 [Caenorhabditis briggsae]
MKTIRKYPKQFNASFYLLYLWDSALNIFTCLTGFYMMRLNTVVSDDSMFAFLYRDVAKYVPMNVFTALSYHMAYVQYTTTALISFNRMTVIWKNERFERHWMKHTWLIMAVVLLVPLLDTHRFIHYKTEIQYDNDTESYEFVPSMPLADTFTFLLPTMVVITVLSVCFNVCSAVLIKRLKSTLSKKGSTKFMVITAVTCIVQLLGCSLSLIRVNETENFFARFLANNVLPIVSDALTHIQPFLLFGFSSVIRRQMMEMLGLRKPNKVNVNTIAMHVNNPSLTSHPL